MTLSGTEIRMFELYWRFGITETERKFGYEGVKTVVEARWPGRTFEELLTVAKTYYSKKKAEHQDRQNSCRFCKIRQDFPDCLSGEAVRLLNRDLGTRIFRTRDGKYYTAREERIPGGKAYFDHTWIEVCPKCGKVF